MATKIKETITPESNTGLIVGLALTVCAFLAGAGIYLFKKKKRSNLNQGLVIEF